MTAGEPPWPAAALPSWINHFLWRPWASCRATLPRLGVFSHLSLFCRSVKATTGSGGLNLYFQPTKIVPLGILNTSNKSYFLGELIWRCFGQYHAIKFYYKVHLITSISACWDLIARVFIRRGYGIIFSSVHWHIASQSSNYRLYLSLMHWHGPTGDWWALTAGCCYNEAVLLPAFTLSVQRSVQFWRQVRKWKRGGLMWFSERELQTFAKKQRVGFFKSQKCFPLFRLTAPLMGQTPRRLTATLGEREKKQSPGLSAVARTEVYFSNQVNVKSRMRKLLPR